MLANAHALSKILHAIKASESLTASGSYGLQLHKEELNSYNIQLATLEISKLPTYTKSCVHAPEQWKRTGMNKV